jgi:hypothetical protein
MGQFTHIIYYYFKDLDQVHFAGRGLPYGDKDQGWKHGKIYQLMIPTNK